MNFDGWYKMEEDIKNYTKSNSQLGYIIKQNCSNTTEIKAIKHLIQNSYNIIGHAIYNNIFLNWGLWNKKIYNEYLNCYPSTYAQIYSQLLLYYLIRPLIHTRFLNKRLLDIGCGNGVGLEISSGLLETQYALGIDLTHKLLTNASSNFYKENTLNYIQADAEHLPLDNECFDIITNLESSHLYPQIELFFSEVERVLAPGGFFCYADFDVTNKQQAKKLESFIAQKKNLKIVKKENITKMVQASIYQRLIVNEKTFYESALKVLNPNEKKFFTEISAVASGMGLEFLPWWKIRFKNPILYEMGKIARKDKYWDKKHYFYYFVQKIGSVR